MARGCAPGRSLALWCDPGSPPPPCSHSAQQWPGCWMVQLHLPPSVQRLRDPAPCKETFSLATAIVHTFTIACISHVPGSSSLSRSQHLPRGACRPGQTSGWAGRAEQTLQGEAMEIKQPHLLEGRHSKHPRSRGPLTGLLQGGRLLLPGRWVTVNTGPLATEGKNLS